MHCERGTSVLRSSHLTLKASRQQRYCPFILVHFTNIFYASHDGQKVGEAMLWLPRKPQFQKTSRDRTCGFRKGMMRTSKVPISVRCSAQFRKSKSSAELSERRGGGLSMSRAPGMLAGGLSQGGWGLEANEPGQPDQDRNGGCTGRISCRPWGQQ